MQLNLCKYFISCQSEWWWSGRHMTGNSDVDVGRGPLHTVADKSTAPFSDLTWSSRCRQSGRWVMGGLVFPMRKRKRKLGILTSSRNSNSNATPDNTRSQQRWEDTSGYDIDEYLSWTQCRYNLLKGPDTACEKHENSSVLALFVSSWYRLELKKKWVPQLWKCLLVVGLAVVLFLISDWWYGVQLFYTVSGLSWWSWVL